MFENININPVLCIGNFAWADIHIGNSKNRRFPGGMGFRFVLACLLYGIPVRFITVLGEEKEWQDILSVLKKNGGLPETVSSVKKSIIFSWKYSKVMHLQDLRMRNIKSQNQIVQLVETDAIKNSSLVNICSLGIMNEEKIVNLVERHKKPISYIFHESNLKDGQKQQYLKMFEKVDYLFLNQKEALLLTGLDTIKKAGSRLSSIAENVFITLGQKGAVIFKNKNVYESCPAIKCGVKDTSGAGDIFAGGTMAGYLLTRNLKSACRFGIILSSISTTDYLTRNLYKLLSN